MDKKEKKRLRSEFEEKLSENQHNEGSGSGGFWGGPDFEGLAAEEIKEYEEAEQARCEKVADYYQSEEYSKQQEGNERLEEFSRAIFKNGAILKGNKKFYKTHQDESLTRQLVEFLSLKYKLAYEDYVKAKTINEMVDDVLCFFEEWSLVKIKNSRIDEIRNTSLFFFCKANYFTSTHEYDKAISDFQSALEMGGLSWLRRFKNWGFYKTLINDSERKKRIEEMIVEQTLKELKVDDNVQTGYDIDFEKDIPF